MNKMSILGPVIFTICFVGYEYVKYGEVKLETLVVGILLGLVIGLVAYIGELKKKGK